MRVSIITPHFNRSSLLAETAASVLAAMGPDDEWIVVDDGSDPTEWERAKMLSSDPRIRWIARNREPKGPSACRNIGLAAARGSFVIYLDSDDLLASGCLEQRVREMNANPALAFIAFNARIFECHPGDKAECWNELGPHDPAGDLRRFLGSHAPWCVSGPIWRFDAIRSLGGFNEQVFYGDDSELHIRALLAGIPYRKASAPCGPDHFVRRSPGVDRATQGWNPAVQASRVSRLTATARALENHDAPSGLRQLWEGQYFIEAEYHLFRNPQAVEAAAAVRKVLELWRHDCQPSCLRRGIVENYFRIALATRRRAYLVLRLARRLAMPLLPDSYFGVASPISCSINTAKNTTSHCPQAQTPHALKTPTTTDP